jgi:D-3-phosphoglycerate dehydrogenase / 2-oxoglutarate reductase
VKALITDYAWPSLDIEREVLGAAGIEIVAAQTGDEAELVELAAGADAIMTCWKQVTPAVLDAAPGCRIVARYGVGLDNIAVDHATALGIVVTNVPDYCVDEVSEHALALLLALARRIVAFSRQTRGGGWDNAAAGPIHRVRGSTLGLIGCGRIGQATGAKARALGMDVIGYDEYAAYAPEGIELVGTLAELLERADAVSVHVPLTEATRGLVGEAELRRMKPTAFLINTARGPVVDAAALARALSEGWIAGAGLDVLPHEPPDAADPLLALENAIVTPHASFYSEESTRELQRRTPACVTAALAGDRPPNVVNPEVLEQAGLRMAAAPRG